MRPNQKTAAKEQQPAKRERGTYKLPLIIEIPPTKHSEEDAAKAETKENASASRDGWLVRFTGILTVATVVLAYFT